MEELQLDDLKWKIQDVTLGYMHTIVYVVEKLFC